MVLEEGFKALPPFGPPAAPRRRWFRRPWHTKRYQPAPRLADGDGPIMAYRRWAQQFYPGQHGLADEQKDAHAASLPSDRQASLLLPDTPRAPSSG
ncbi:hypothetical protein [Streptomyces sp. NBC_00211]|uniref:hypothetical protein n=1 Tax=Streptomyces sp. NBC_00211 TaxID=2975683 RepID=UPI0038669097